MALKYSLKPTFLLYRRLLNRRSIVFQKFKPQNLKIVRSNSKYLVELIAKQLQKVSF